MTQRAKYYGPGVKAGLVYVRAQTPREEKLDSPTEFGKLLRRKREQKGMTIRQLALYAGCSDSYLSMLERGVRGSHGPSLHILKGLSKPLGMPLETLAAVTGHLPEALAPAFESKTIIQVLRESLGDTRERFAERAELSLQDVELLEKMNPSIDSVEVICENLFARSRLLTSAQKALILRLEKAFCASTPESSRLLEKVLSAMLGDESSREEAKNGGLER